MITREEIIKFAKNSDLHCHVSLKQEHGLVIEDLTHFAQAIYRKAIEDAAVVVLESGFKSNGVPAYESIAEKVRKLGETK